jgi:hypothetical protein
MVMLTASTHEYGRPQAVVRCSDSGAALGIETDGAAQPAAAAVRQLTPVRCFGPRARLAECDMHRPRALRCVAMDEEHLQEQSSLTGDIEPHEPGEWVTLDEAGARLGIDRKAVYRRIQRGRMHGKKAPHGMHLLVWVPLEEQRSRNEESTEEELRSLAVPDGPERLARIVEQATSPLVSRIEELIRENERLRLEGERHSQEQEQERAAWVVRLEAAERTTREAIERRRRWWPW